MVGPSSRFAGHRRDGGVDGRAAAVAGAGAGAFQFPLAIGSLGIAVGVFGVSSAGDGDFTLQHLVIRDVVKAREGPQAIQSDLAVDGRASEALAGVHCWYWWNLPELARTGYALGGWWSAGICGVILCASSVTLEIFRKAIPDADGDESG